MPATSDKDDKQGLVVLPSYGWLALFPYSRSSLFSRYTHFHCFAFFVSFTDVSFLMPGQFWWWRLFTFWERNVPGPLPQRSNRKLESKKFFSMDPGTACHYHGAAGKVDSSGGSFAGFQKMLIFRCFLLGLCAGFPPLSFNFELPWKRTFPEIALFDGWYFCGKM